MGTKKKTRSEASEQDNKQGAKRAKSDVQEPDYAEHEPEAEEQEIEAEEELEGIIYEGCLLLEGKTTRKIFNSVRDDEGNLVIVGRRRKNGELKFYTYDWKLNHLDKEEAGTFNFKVTDPTDHCETGVRAYIDIVPTLNCIADLLDNVKSCEDLRIWDPYYCTGRVKARLLKLGFPHVYNENEDFYASIRNSRFPHHDIVLTNPPYSQDHIPRLLQFCAASEKPCLLLVPSYVVTKSYFAQMKESRLFVVPKTGRYTYNNPGFEGVKGGRTAPFQTIWIIFGKSIHSQLMEKLRKSAKARDAMFEVYFTDNSIPARFFDKD